MGSEPQHIHFLLEELDYNAQFSAIIRLLNIQEQDRKHLDGKIERMRKIAAQTIGAANYQAEQEWVALCHESCYQEAAHSMAAVGMIAPFTESVFQHAFPEDYQRILDSKEHRRKSLVDKVMALVHQVNIIEFMPDDLKPTLSALFAYRNKMFHHGFEWPQRERRNFDNQLIESDWPEDWFQRATSGEQPWMFYMSPKFIDHCLKQIEKIITGIEEFDEKGV